VSFVTTAVIRDRKLQFSVIIGTQNSTIDRKISSYSPAPLKFCGDVAECVSRSCMERRHILSVRMWRSVCHADVWRGAIFLALHILCIARPTCSIMASGCTVATQRRPMNNGTYGSPDFPFLQPSLLYIIHSQSLIDAEVSYMVVTFG
jgi:hypothetical protein